MSLVEIVKGMANAGEAINENFLMLSGFEHGSNENGDFWKHPSGFMVCVHTDAAGPVNINNGIDQGQIHQSTPKRWDFPEPFEQLLGFGGIPSNLNRWCTYRSISGTGFDWAHNQGNSNSGTVSTRLYAFGFAEEE